MLDLWLIKRLLTSRVNGLPYTKLPARTGESSASSGSRDNMVNLSVLALEPSAHIEGPGGCYWHEWKMQSLMGSRRKENSCTHRAALQAERAVCLVLQSWIIAVTLHCVLTILCSVPLWLLGLLLEEWLSPKSFLERNTRS